MRSKGSGFWVQGSEVLGQGSGFSVLGLGLEVQRFRVLSSAPPLAKKNDQYDQ